MKVSGECGMCKKKIEKAAKDAGASYAVWTSDAKVLEVKYNNESTNTDKIQQKIADVGYDTPKFRATDEAYDKLSPCCHYDREPVLAEAKSASMKCEMKEGKTVDGSACKDMGSHAGDAKCKDGDHAGHQAMNCAEGNNKGKSTKSCCQQKKTD